MEHKTLEELAAVSDVTPVAARLLTRRERLLCWAAALEKADGCRHAAQHSDYYWKLLGDSDYYWKLLGAGKLHHGYVSQINVHGLFWRAGGINKGTAFWFAAQDPVLRADGLSATTIGDVVSYLGLSGRWVHRNLCFCVASGSVRSLVREIRHEAERRFRWRDLFYSGGLA